MKRWHNETFRMNREKSRAAAHGIDREMGRFRKKKSLDCGKSGCLLCHGDKFPKRDDTIQETMSEMKFLEEMEDRRWNNEEEG